MFSNGNFLIYFVVFLQCTNFATILLGEPTTDNYSAISFNHSTANSNKNASYNYVHKSNVTDTKIKIETTLMAEHPSLKIALNLSSNVSQSNTSIGEQNKNVHNTMELPPTYETLPQPEALYGGASLLQQRHQPLSPSPSAANEQNGPLPVFPERNDAVYFIVAIIGGAKAWGRELAHTLMDMGPPFTSPLGPPLRPLYVDLPSNGRFSIKVLSSFCEQTDGIPLAGIIIIGDGQSARAIAMSGHSMRIPVLWARGGTANIHTTQNSAETDLQTLLQPSAREILEALRVLLIQTHWHSFFVLSDVDATIVLSGSEGSPLKEPPLTPKILPLPVGNSNVFRQLAEISRSTRGIILMLCNLVSARQIMSEAKRLNMAGGHFIWLWADTSSTAEFFDVHKTSDAFDVDDDDGILQYPEAVKHFKNGINIGIPTVSSVDIKPIPRGNRVKPVSATTSSPSGGSGRTGRVDSKTETKDQTGSSSNSGSSDESDEDDGNMFRQFDNSVERKINVDDKGERLPNLKQKEEERHSSTSKKPRTQPQYYVDSNGEPILPYGNGVINGRYIFGIGPSSVNDENSDEKFLNQKLKRSPSESIEDQGIKKSKDKLNYDNKSEEYSDEMNFNTRFDYDIDNNNNEDNNSNNKKNAANNNNNTESFRKPKRTSTAYFGKNLTTSSHVLFHHFKDFPVGLLALKPVKMPVDSNFVRSTIRLFAATWAQVEIEAAIEEEKLRLRNINPYGDNINWLMQQRNHGRPQRSIVVKRQIQRRQIYNSIQVNKIFNNYLSENNNNNNNTSNLKTQIGDSKSNRSDINNSSFYNNINNNNNNNNQNLSGLNNQNKLQSNIINNNQSYINENLSMVNNVTKTKNVKTKMNSKSKRSNSLWWSTKDVTNRFRSQSTIGQQRSYGYLDGIGGSEASYSGASGLGVGGGSGNGSSKSRGSINSSSSGDRYRKVVPYYRGGCFGSASPADINRAETFSKALHRSTAQALSGRKLPDGSLARPLIAKFELLNLIPHTNTMTDKLFQDELLVRRRGPRRQDPHMTKWRRVGVITGRNVQLDTIVWPGGDIVVSGLSAKSRTVFRIVTALAPPFVMESELDEDGVCLRGLPCHRLLSTAKHNLTLMFNAIETRDRMREDAVEHGAPPPTENSNGYDHSLYETRCCYGLSMDLLDNIATELEFEFHLYIVHDELFGSQFSTLDEFVPFSQERGHLRTGSGSGNRRRQKMKAKTNQAPVGQTTEQYGTTTQRKYHSPEGRTRNFRSASFEREVNSDKENFDDNKYENTKMRSEKIKLNIRKRREMAYVNDAGDNNDNDDELFSNDWNGDGAFDGNDDDVNDDDNNGGGGGDDPSRYRRPKRRWNGIIGDLLAGSAEMSFAPLTVTRARAEVIDFSVPYFHSGVSLMAAPQSKSEIPLLAFLLPFSPELWIAIFTSLNVTAVAVAIYEWLSPFGLNPWGRQRSKNFSMSSALWVMWGLLCGHLVAFKAPKSWPNKFLINVWGGFSVIFIASYTANIAALIAGLFFHNAANRPEVSLLTQRVGAPTSSATESFMKLHRPHEWEHIRKYTLKSVEDGVQGLKNGSLDLLLGDTPILDYYRAIDHGCKLIRIGETYVEDTYAIGMKKGFPLKDSISALIAKYSSNGYLDILSDKWYGGLPCYKLDTDIIMPRPLGVAAVAGVFLLLGLGIAMGVLILIFEHWFYKYMLPNLRHKPKGSVWRSRNIMFFSQKLYRFINCVELVSPHHAARELVTTLRQGQIASLFQKSIKRKEDEQRRRRKSKAQFFEMIQEIRRVQQAERQNKLEAVNEAAESGETSMQIPEIITPHSRSPKPKSSPRPKIFPNRHNRSKSNCSTLNIRRFSTDSILSERLDTIGRRLSRDLTNSPPDFSRRLEPIEKVMSLSSSNGKFETYAGKDDEIVQETKFDTYCGKDLLVPMKKHQNRRTPLNSETFQSKKTDELEITPTIEIICKSPIAGLSPLPVVKEGLVHPICQEDETKAILRDRLHEELITKYGESHYETLPIIRTAATNVPTIQRASLRSKERSPMQLKRSRQRSLDGLDSRPKMPTPSPTRSRHEGESSNLSPPEPLYSQVSPKSNLQKISLDRLSREDLLKLSESSQTEIHEYLSKSLSTDRTKEPP